MSSNVRLLEPILNEHLAANTSIFQTEDGTKYYCKFDDPMRLYVKSGGEVFDAQLPSTKFQHTVAYKNAIYVSLFDFVQQAKQIVKVVFSSSYGFHVSHVRDQIKGEEFHSHGLCSRTISGKTYIYRFSDDPYRDCVTFNISNSERQGLEFKAILRGKIICLSKTDSHTPSVYTLRDNVIVVKMKYDYNAAVYAKDCSAYAYISVMDSKLYILDSESMTMMHSLQFWGVKQVWRVSRIHKGEISINVKSDENCFLYSAQLPNEYRDNLNTEKEELNIEQNSNQVNTEKKTAIHIINDNLDSVWDQCCCPVCNENFDSDRIIPRILDCGHSFCEVCIQQLHTEEKVKCPNCSVVTDLPNGKVLPKNFGMISISEQLLKTRIESKVTCKSCEMFNQTLCVTCALDGEHGSHVVKYDVKIKQIRSDLRIAIDSIVEQVEGKKKSVLEKAEQLEELLESVKKNLSEAAIPSHVLSQLNKICSEQEASDYKDIVEDLAKTIIDQCETLIESFDTAISSAKSSFLWNNTNFPIPVIQTQSVQGLSLLEDGSYKGN